MSHRPSPPAALGKATRSGSIAAAIGGLALVAATAAAAADPATASLTITFHGLKAGGGFIMAGLVDSPAAYDGKAAATGQGRVAVQGDHVTMTFSGLKPGRYAVRAFHDLNGDGKLGTNPFGMPTEPYAFSNNAKGSMGPAKWEAAAFDLKPGENTQTIEID